VERCQRSGAVSIFDEVMTGSRVSRGGAQQRFGLKPALTCLGKVVGGGMPLALYGGQREIMRQIAPLGPVYQAGTLSGNPLAVSAGLATLELLTETVYDWLEVLGNRLEAGLNDALRSTGVVGCVQRVGAMLTLFFRQGPVENYAQAAASNHQLFGAWHRGLVQRNIYWPPSGYEAAFISAAHSEADIDQTIAAARESLAAL
jgi:glutamate-1-semialdehyde 2,1-aminomutase